MFGRIGNIVAGIWLVIAPFMLGYVDLAARTNDIWTGLAIIAVALMGLRVAGARFVNTGLGAWLAASPWLLDYGGVAAVANDVIVGLLVIGLSLVPTYRRIEIRRDRTVLP